MRRNRPFYLGLLAALAVIAGCGKKEERTGRHDCPGRAGGCGDRTV